MNELTPAQILKEIGKIRRMEIGCLRRREDGNYNLSSYEFCPEDGRKRTRTQYVAAADHPAVAKLVEAGDRFCDLVEDYANLIIASTRGERDAIKERRKEKNKMPTEHAERPMTVVGKRIRGNQTMPPQISPSKVAAHVVKPTLEPASGGHQPSLPTTGQPVPKPKMP